MNAGQKKQLSVIVQHSIYSKWGTSQVNHSTVNNLGRESVFAEEMKGKRDKTAQGGFRRKVNPEKNSIFKGNKKLKHNIQL